MFGLDCEMCLTSIQKLELARISIVNEKLEVRSERLVSVSARILNFICCSWMGTDKQSKKNLRWS